MSHQVSSLLWIMPEILVFHTNLLVLVGTSTLSANGREGRNEHSTRQRLLDMVCPLTGQDLPHKIREHSPASNFQPQKHFELALLLKKMAFSLTPAFNMIQKCYLNSICQTKTSLNHGQRNSRFTYSNSERSKMAE